MRSFGESAAMDVYSPPTGVFLRVTGQPATEREPNSAGLYQTHGRILVQSWPSGTAFTPRNLGILPQICQLTPRLGENFPGPVGSVANPPLPGKLDTKTSSSEWPPAAVVSPLNSHAAPARDVGLPLLPAPLF